MSSQEFFHDGQAEASQDTVVPVRLHDAEIDDLIHIQSERLGRAMYAEEQDASVPPQREEMFYTKALAVELLFRCCRIPKKAACAELQHPYDALYRYSAKRNLAEATSEEIHHSLLYLKNALRPELWEQWREKLHVQKLPERPPRSSMTRIKASSTNLADALQERDFGFEPMQYDEEEFVPTDAFPNTPEKLAVLAERVRRGFPLWHPDDRKDYEGSCGLPGRRQKVEEGEDGEEEAM